MKLLDYIRGLRKGKEAHRLEKESMKDPFLADAMDGYQQVEGKHEERIKELQTLITARSTKKRNSYAITWSIAACLIIGVGISSYFLFLKSNMPEDTFIAKETIHTTAAVPEVPMGPETPGEKVTHSPSATKTKQDSNLVAISDKATKENRFVKSKVTSTPKKVSTEITGPIEEEIIESTIDTTLIQSNEKDIKKIELTANAKNVINGMVTDDKGQPLIGVNITYWGKRVVPDDKDQSPLVGSINTYEKKKYGTITDIYGRFSIPKEQFFGKLEANYIGYDPVSIIVKDSIRPLFIAMKESPQSTLDQVVIAGAGEQKKMRLTGAVTTVKVEDLKKTPPTNALAGAISKEALENLLKSNSDSAKVESPQSTLDQVVIAGAGEQKKMRLTGAVTTVKVENLKQPSSPNTLAGIIPGIITKSSKQASKQIMPKPVTGMKQYQKYLKKNLIQPTDKTCSESKGIVIVTFFVNEKGRPFQIKIKKGLCESTDKEAIRLIQEGPDWTHGNKPVEIKVKFK
ncbi:hypothetical protein [Bacteroides sp.]|uniref:hypothetical protein n=1 Tax=Bacteroides sp. TaxID=29523 RepID=UPI00261533FB|nr:hypothetical protein [Bacteroides sp.]MDD3036694.1 hypothetical protein [Bacteroides sp.]